MVALRLKKVLLNQAGVRAAISDLASQIVEHCADAVDDLVIVGIHTGGAHLARRLQRSLRRRLKKSIPLGTIDITLYRDDVFRGLEVPQVGVTDINFSMADKVVVLVDDVIYTGRTVRAALDQITDLGRPRRVWLAVLVDRGLRELPIQPDFVALKVETTPNQSVKVELKEEGYKEDRVVLRERVESKRKGKGS